MFTPFQNGTYLPDSQLIERFQADDPEVFGPLYHRHRDRIHDVIFRVIPNPEDVHHLSRGVSESVSGACRFQKGVSILHLALSHRR